MGGGPILHGLRITALLPCTRAARTAGDWSHDAPRPDSLVQPRARGLRVARSPHYRRASPRGARWLPLLCDLHPHLPRVAPAGSRNRSGAHKGGRGGQGTERAREAGGRRTLGVRLGDSPTSVVAVVLPGGPLYLLGHEPPAAEARYHRAVGPP